MFKFWLRVDNQSKIVSAITRVEAFSAIQRWSVEGRITADEAVRVLGSVRSEIELSIERPLTRTVLEAAAMIVGRRNLRALDAIQLGSAIIARDLLGSQGMQFIASDRALLEAAEAEGFSIWNPAVS